MIENDDDEFDYDFLNNGLDNDQSGAYARSLKIKEEKEKQR